MQDEKCLECTGTRAISIHHNQHWPSKALKLAADGWYFCEFHVAECHHAPVPTPTILNLEMVEPVQVLRDRQILKRQRGDYNQLVLAQQGGSTEKVQEELNDFDQRGKLPAKKLKLCLSKPPATPK